MCLRGQNDPKPPISMIRDIFREKNVKKYGIRGNFLNLLFTQWQVKRDFFQASLQCLGGIFQSHLQCLGVVCKSHLYGWEASYIGSCPTPPSGYDHVCVCKLPHGCLLTCNVFETIMLIQGSPQKKKSSGRYLKNLNLARASSIIKYLLLHARA